jgi:hypothetical protein
MRRGFIASFRQCDVPMSGCNPYARSDGSKIKLSTGQPQLGNSGTLHGMEEVFAVDATSS